jgi:hypothetical protein
MSTSVDEQFFKFLKEKSQESTTRLSELINEYGKLKNKEDVESRIKKLELSVGSLFHGLMIETARNVEMSYEIADTLKVTVRSIETLHKKIEKLGTKDVVFDQEMFDMKEKVTNTLIPLQEKIEADKKILERDDGGIYG